SMSEQAGAPDTDEGLWYGSVLWTPSKCWEVFAGDYYTPELFNTFFGSAKYKHDGGSCAFAQYGVQATDQRSVGDELIGEFETWNVGVGARVVWETGWSIGAAFRAT